MEFQNRILHRLREAGYGTVDTALENKEGKLVSLDRDENRYVVKDWFSGRECSSFGPPGDPGSRGKSGQAPLPDGISRRRENLLRTPSEAGAGGQDQRAEENPFLYPGREPKHPFEQMFLDSFPAFYSQAREAADLAEEAGGEAELARQIETGCVCHGDYTYHHVLFLEEGIATTNFGRCRFDYQVNDLYQFMRKILEKQDWDPGLGEQMLFTYEEIRPMPEAERRILYVRMAFPEKFWKLANHYYGGSKAWIPGLYLQKLKTLNGQEKQRHLF